MMGGSSLKPWVKLKSAPPLVSFTRDSFWNRKRKLKTNVLTSLVTYHHNKFSRLIFTLVKVLFSYFSANWRNFYNRNGQFIIFVTHPLINHWRISSETSLDRFQLGKLQSLEFFSFFKGVFQNLSKSRQDLTRLNSKASKQIIYFFLLFL